MYRKVLSASISFLTVMGVAVASLTNTVEAQPVSEEDISGSVSASETPVAEFASAQGKLDFAPVNTSINDLQVFKEYETSNLSLTVNDVDEEEKQVKGIDEGVYPSCPFIEAVDTDRIIWYTGNMKICNSETSLPDYEATEEDLEWMAKIMHAEICAQGSEARRAVGTVIMNRIEWNQCPDTVLGVISQEGQFSPWSNGSIDNDPCDYCIEAAYDVLVNGYRAFPREVRYFESIEDGYFDDILTYAYYTECGYDTWFGFFPGDIDNPDISEAEDELEEA
jgi:hypothetical protein